MEEEAKKEKHQKIEDEKKRRARIKKGLELTGKGALFAVAVICGYLFGKKKSGQS